MAARTRSRSLHGVTPGTYRYVNANTGADAGLAGTGASGFGTFQRTVDETMAPPYYIPHAFLSEKYGTYGEPLRIYGTVPYIAGVYNLSYLGWNPPNRSLNVYAPAITPVNWAYWLTKALANLNPNAPVVDLPLFLFEFKDFPSMLRNLGEVLSKRVSPKAVPEGYLAYSFGWAPLVNDLFKLFDLSNQIENRKRYLQRLENGGHIRRSLGGGVVQHTITPNGYGAGTSSSGSVLRADVALTEKQTVWYTANAKLLDPLPDAAPLQFLTENIVTGLNVSPSTAWNMIPWSWLIDYFSNIGDFMQANRGGLRFQTTRICIMCTSKVESKLVNVRMVNGSSYTGGTLTNITKQRYVSLNPRPQLTWDPFLSGSQILNLGALSTAKALKAFK